MKTYTVCAAYYDSDSRAIVNVLAESYADACLKAIEMIDNGEVSTQAETFDPSPTFIYGVIEGEDGDPWMGTANVPLDFVDGHWLLPDETEPQVRRYAVDRRDSGILKDGKLWLAAAAVHDADMPGGIGRLLARLADLLNRHGEG